MLYRVAHAVVVAERPDFPRVHVQQLHDPVRPAPSFPLEVHEDRSGKHAELPERRLEPPEREGGGQTEGLQQRKS